MIVSFRQSQGLSQRALASLLTVDQTTISRWERGDGVPGARIRRQLRDLMRRSPGSRLDRLARLRVQMSDWPATLLRQGAVLLEMSRAVPAEVSMADLPRGRSLYGLFGEEADEQVFAWERSGIFSGELAMTVSLNRIQTPSGPVWFRGMDTPHLCEGGEIWCLCEIRRLTAEEYETSLKQMGSPLISIPFDQLG